MPQLVARVRAGGSDDEILDWCFANFARPDKEKIKFWNNFAVKRGWRDDSTQELEETKRANKLGDRADIQTWVDFHDKRHRRREREMMLEETVDGEGPVRPRAAAFVNVCPPWIRWIERSVAR